MNTITPCRKCHTAEYLHASASPHGWSIVCTNCYEADLEGERFVSLCKTASGRTENEAVKDWNESDDAI